jgi:hypothetical protein
MRQRDVSLDGWGAELREWRLVRSVAVSKEVKTIVNAQQCIRSTARWLAAGLAFTAASYAMYVAVTWYRYGRAAQPTDSGDRDSLLDRFIPMYEVAERHHVRVVAPAETTFFTACHMYLQQSAVVRAIFKGRELILGGKSEEKSSPLGLVAQAKAWGWGVLAEVPGREIIFGGVTQPWLANPVFRALPPDEFEAFDEPGYVKIAWTLRADPIDAAKSVFRTETRVATTDPTSRAQFRRYWAFLSPGIKMIRWISLGPLKTEAERRAHQALLNKRENLLSGSVSISFRS